MEQIKSTKQNLSACPLIVLIKNEANVEQKSTISQWVNFFSPLFQSLSMNNYCFMEMKTRKDVPLVFLECARRVINVRDFDLPSVIQELKDVIKNDSLLLNPSANKSRCVLN